MIHELFKAMPYFFLVSASKKVKDDDVVIDIFLL